MSATRSLRLSSRILHNGKGRPFLSVGSQRRLLSTTILQSRPSFIRVHSPTISLLSGTDILKAPNAYRYASTMPGATVGQGSSIATSSEPGNAWDAPLEMPSETSINIEPHIGWLKEMGVDHGWGPTSVMQWILEHIQVYSGLPWAESVIVMAIVVRLAILPLILNSSDMAARSATMAPILKPIQERSARARENQDQQALLQSWQEMMAVYRQSGIKTRVMFYPMILSTFVGIGSFYLTRSLATLPVPGVDTGSFLWLTDLTVSDPFYILPTISAGLTWLVMNKGGEMGTMTGTQAELINFFKKFAPPLVFVGSFIQPGLVQIGWVAAALTALAQTSALRSNYWRRIFKLQPFPETRAAASPGTAGPYQGVLNKYQPPSIREANANTFYGKMKAKARDYLRKKERKAPRRSKQEMSKAERYEQERRKEIEADLVDKERRGRRR